MAETELSNDEVRALARSLTRTGGGSFTSSELEKVIRWMLEERAGAMMLEDVIGGRADVAVRNGELIFLSVDFRER